MEVESFLVSTFNLVNGILIYCSEKYSSVITSLNKVSPERESS
jgi:hypothetical protein